jgi:IS6 family transposase
MGQQHPFKWRHFEAEIILLCVRWYLRYPLSYRDLEELMLERGLQVDHTTIYRSRPALRPRTGPALPPAPQRNHRLRAWSMKPTSR